MTYKLVAGVELTAKNIYVGCLMAVAYYERAYQLYDTLQVEKPIKPTFIIAY